MCAARSISTTKIRNKLALVIGNNNYEARNQLKNPVNDATDMTNILKTIDFDVDEFLNATYDDMNSLLETFVERITSNDIVLFYFAGHGHQWEDQNYLIPSNDDYIEGETIKDFAINVQEILNRITEKRPFVAILLLDCCREYHLRHHELKGIGRGLHDFEPPKGLKKIYTSSHCTNVLIAFACAAGQIASDVSVHGRNGLFTWHLLQHITTPNQDIAMILRDVARDVQNETMDKMFPQVPWINCSLIDRNIFLRGISNTEPHENETNEAGEDVEGLGRLFNSQLQLDSKFHFGGTVFGEESAAATENTATTEKGDTFESRYAADYQTIKVLGKGGFGYVFEVINKLDGRRLAVKRIAFKNEHEQEMALKEVRALVRLDHPYIIPYYHAWIEIPPLGWQRQEDKTYDWRELSRDTTYTNDSETVNTNTSITTTTTSRTRTGEQDSSGEELYDYNNFLKSPKKNTIENTHTSYSTGSFVGTQSDIPSNEGLNKQDNIKVPKKTSYLYYSMKLCEGESLKQRLIPYKLTKEQACNVVHQIAEGIAYIHGEMLIHGDIKPANIFFSAGNLIKIGDFGLVAEMVDNNQTVITNCKNQGTDWYMAPELRKKGQGIHYDKKVDIYAMGIVFLEVLAPFKTDSERSIVLEKIQKSTKQSLDLTPILRSYEKAVDLHLSYEPIIQWLLKPLPSERPSAKDLLENESFRRVIKGIHVDKFLTSARLTGHISLPTADIAHGCFDCSQQLILLCQNNIFRLFDQDGQELYQLRWNQQDYLNYGFVGQIVWSTYLKVFLVVANRALFTIQYSHNRMTRRKKGAVYAMDGEDRSRLRFITCASANDHLFLNRGYHTIQQYKMADWTTHREWTRISLNYNDRDEIRDISTDRDANYLVMNVRENGTTWVIDVRITDDNLTRHRHIAGFYHKLQMYSPSSHWLFVRGDPNKLYLYDVQGDDAQIPKEVSFGDNEDDPQFSFSKITPIYFRWMGQTHLVLGTVVDSDQTGSLKIYRV